MTKQFTLSTLAAALLVLGTSSAFAQDGFIEPGADTISYGNYGYGEIVKRANVDKDIRYSGTVEVDGTISVDGAAFGMTDNKQVMDGNSVDSGTGDTMTAVTNAASIDASATGTTGVVGANVAAGDVNAQDNAVAIAYADMASVLGSADATAMSYQLSNSNSTDQYDVENTASVTNGSLNGASGIVGANVTSGSFNAQKNNTVVAVSTGTMAEADVWAKQEVTNAITNHYGEIQPGSGTQSDTITPVMNSATLMASLAGTTGVIGVNISAGTSNLQANSTSVAATIGSLGGL